MKIFQKTQNLPKISVDNYNPLSKNRIYFPNCSLSRTLLSPFPNLRIFYFHPKTAKTYSLVN